MYATGCAADQVASTSEDWNTIYVFKRKKKD